MNYAEADALLQGRCHKRRKLGADTYLERRGRAIAVSILFSDRLVFHPDGRIDVDGRWLDRLKRRHQISGFLPKPWLSRVFRKHTILYRAKDGPEKGWWVWDLVTIRPNGPIRIKGPRKKGDLRPFADVYEEVRKLDRLRARSRQRLHYWRRKVERREPSRLSVAAILKEANVQIRAVKIQAYGLERYVREAGAQTIDSSGEYVLLRIGFDRTRELVCLKMVCPSTGVAYYSPVPPGTRTVDRALDWMFGVRDYRKNLVAES